MTAQDPVTGSVPLGVEVVPAPAFPEPGSRESLSLRVQYALKRAIDLVTAGFLLLLLSPLLLVVALAIKLSSPGPVLYRQIRVRRGGHEFTLFKFRTMVIDADDRLHEVLHLNHANGPLFKSRDDPRLTAAGRLLRGHYLDELPQLINVLIGDMSMVGPRPCLPRELARQPEALSPRLAVPQGVTGPWQTNGHHAVSFEDQLRIEGEYIHGWTLARDLAIFARTLPLILRGTGL